MLCDPDPATVVLVIVWWISLSVVLKPGSNLPASYELCLTAFFIWIVLCTCILMYQANRARPRRLSRSPGDLRTLAAGLLFLLLGSFSAFERSTDAYLDTRHRSAELDREIKVAPVYLPAAQGRWSWWHWAEASRSCRKDATRDRLERLWSPRSNEGPGSELPEPSIV